MGVCPFSFGGFCGLSVFGHAGTFLHRSTPRYGDYNRFPAQKAGRTRCVNAKIVVLLQIQQSILYTYPSRERRVRASFIHVPAVGTTIKCVSIKRISIKKGELS